MKKINDKTEVKMLKVNYKNNTPSLSVRLIGLVEIIVLILSTISFAYMVGQEFRIVSAAECIKGSSGKEFKVSQITPKTWCPENGETTRCIQSSRGTWALKRNLTYECSSTPSRTNGIDASANVKAAISKFLPAPKFDVKIPSRTTSTDNIPGSGTGKADIFTYGNLEECVKARGEQDWGCRYGAGIYFPDPDKKPVTPEQGVAVATGGKWATRAKFVGSMVYHAGVALTLYATTRFIVTNLGASPELANSAGLAVGAGYAAVKVGVPVLEKLFHMKSGSLLAKIGLGSWGTGIVVAIVVFALTYKETRYRAVSFTCYPWDAPRGGQNCEKCNDGEFPCTEYQCKSLGQACSLENQGTTEELCVWKSRNDVNPPVIQAWTRPLSTGYAYIPNNAISPPDRGVRIVPQGNNSGCVKPFSNISFGITLDEPAKCKIDTQRKNSFAEMDFFFGGSSTTKYNHSQVMNLPSPEALASENMTLTNNKEFTLYARCEDTNGNDNVANFVFNFCVDAGPDTTAPVIVSTSIINGMPIAAGQNTTPLQVYTNEPSTCKWSRVDQSYDGMENNMTCRNGVFQMNAQGLYQCGTNLTGLRDAENNDFFFKCKDQPHLAGTANESRRNANAQSYKFTLIGTRPLVISSLAPSNETIRDATNVIQVTLEAETSAGFNEGEAICSFKDSSDEDNGYIEFFNTGSFEHSQDLFLPAGNYTYDIRCMDLGGNADTESTSFRIETDTDEPRIVRVFRQQSSLKVITNERASCVYSNNNCNYLFADGTDMSSTDEKIHSTSWNPDKTFYIKCEDEFRNQPQPDQCSLVASPYSIGTR